MTTELMIAMKLIKFIDHKQCAPYHCDSAHNVARNQQLGPRCTPSPCLVTGLLQNLLGLWLATPPPPQETQVLGLYFLCSYYLRHEPLGLGLANIHS